MDDGSGVLVVGGGAGLELVGLLGDGAAVEVGVGFDCRLDGVDEARDVGDAAPVPVADEVAPVELGEALALTLGVGVDVGVVGATAGRG